MSTEHDTTDDGESIFDTDTLEVDGNTVTGTLAAKDGEWVLTASVKAYDYQRGGETRTNYVPLVVLEHETTGIVKEGEPQDAHTPGVAMTNARRSANWLWENREQFR